MVPLRRLQEVLVVLEARAKTHILLSDSFSRTICCSPEVGFYVAGCRS